MPNLSRLEALIARLAGIDFSQSSEQDTREIAVNTVIGELGWDTLDRNEVSREYSVRGGRVDYCLRSQARNLVLIEVKRAGTDLTEHQEQLLRYAFDEGASLAVLTDGLVWWLYLPMVEVRWEQRRFSVVNFHEQAPTDSAGTLYRFLNRDGVVSSEAAEEVKREFESQERDRRVRAALQDAWRQMLGDPNSLLCEELADKVEEISGHRADQHTITDFLLGMIGNAGGGSEASAVRVAIEEPRQSNCSTKILQQEESWETFLNTLLGKSLDFWCGGRHVTIGRLIDIAIQARDPQDEDRDHAITILAEHGIRVDLDMAQKPKPEWWVYLANRSPGLRRLMQDEIYGAASAGMAVWVQAARRIPGAERAPARRFAKSKPTKCTRFPLSVVTEGMEQGAYSLDLTEKDA